MLDLLELRPRFSKKWRTSIVCLELDALVIAYKSKSNSKFRIKLKDLRYIKKCAVSQRLLCLEIRSRYTTVFLSCLTVRQAMNWYEALSASRQHLQPSLRLPNSLHEACQNTSVYVITITRDIKRYLAEREEELMLELEQAYQAVEAQTRAAIESLAAVSMPSPVKVREAAQKTGTVAKTLTLADSVPALTSVSFYAPPHLLSRYMRSAVSLQRKHFREQTVRRCKRLQEVSWCYCPDRFDALTIQVNAEVCLLGVAINSPCWKGELLCVNQLQVLRGQSDQSPAVYKHSEQEYAEYTGRATFQVRFTRPVAIQAGAPYTIIAQIFGDDSFKCWECSPKVLNADGVEWSFKETQFRDPEQSNNTGPMKGIFPELFYYKIQ